MSRYEQSVGASVFGWIANPAKSLARTEGCCLFSTISRCDGPASRDGRFTRMGVFGFRSRIRCSLGAGCKRLFNKGLQARDFSLAAFGQTQLPLDAGTSAELG